MLEFLQEHAAFVIYLIGFLFAILVFFLKRMLNDYDRRIIIIEDDMDAIRKNYTDRFTRAASQRNSMEKNILKSISDLALAHEKSMNRFEIANEKSHNAILETIRKRS